MIFIPILGYDIRDVKVAFRLATACDGGIGTIGRKSPDVFFQLRGFHLDDLLEVLPFLCGFICFLTTIRYI